MNRLLTLGIVALTMIILAIPSAAEARREVTMNMTNKPVIFDHERHVTTDCTSCHTTIPAHFPMLTTNVSMSCQTCHHLVEGEAAPTPYCSACHFDPSPQVRGGSSYYALAHARDPLPDTVSCLSCHYEVAKQRPEMRKALTACSGSSCHP